MTQDIPLYSLRAAREPGRLRDVEVLRCGHLPEKRVRLHVRFAYHAAVLVASGAGDFQVDDDPVQEVGPGSFFVVHPGPVFRFGPSDGGSWEEHHLCLGGEGLQRLIDSGLLPVDRRVHQIAEHRDLVPLFERIGALLQGHRRGDIDRAVLGAQQLLVEATYARVGRTAQVGTGTAIAAVLEACRRELHRPIDFPALAAAHGMSYSALRQRLRRATGLPPAQYLMRLRCERAQQLLVETDLPVAAVGERVGIPDPFSFSRAFKRTVGRSPRQYRQDIAPWLARR